MSRELLYAKTSGSASVAAGANVPIATVLRRVGYAAELEGDSAILHKPGYYSVTATVVTQSAAGAATVAIQQDGATVPGMESVVTAEASTTYTIPVSGIVRVKCRCDTPSKITLVNTGSVALTVSLATLEVEYLG